MSYLGGREIFGYAKVMGRFSPPECSRSGCRSSRSAATPLGEGAAWRPSVELRAGAARPRARADPPRAVRWGCSTSCPACRTCSTAELAIADRAWERTLWATDRGQGRPGLPQAAPRRRRRHARLHQSVVEAPVGSTGYSPARPRTIGRSPCTTSTAIRSGRSWGYRPARRASFDIEIDFEVEDGYEIGRVTATGDTGAAGLAGAPGAARWTATRACSAARRAGCGVSSPSSSACRSAA